jgi:hypothetical protein
MTYTVLVRIDAAGRETPVVLDEDCLPVVGEDGVRFRLVAETDDELEAFRVAHLIRERCRAGGPTPPQEVKLEKR